VCLDAEDCHQVFAGNLYWAEICSSVFLWIEPEAHAVAEALGAQETVAVFHQGATSSMGRSRSR